MLSIIEIVIFFVKKMIKKILKRGQYYHIISLSQWCSKYSLHALKWPHPKNQLYALKGDGWAAFKIRCFEWSMSDSLLWANLPHNIKTTCSLWWDKELITLSVNVCQPTWAWDKGLPSSTVKNEFNSNTHWSAQWVRSQLW